MTHPGAVEALRLSDERHRSLLAAIAQIVWNTDARGQVIDDQPGWRAFTGQTSAEIQGSGWLAAVHPDSCQEAILGWEQAVSQNSPYETEWRLRRRDGGYRCFSIRAAPVLANNGTVREWIGCNIDITRHRQSEEELRRLHADARAALVQQVQRGRDMQILKNLGDTLQACNSRQEAYPFIALAATELFPGASGALAVPSTEVREVLEAAAEWGGVACMKRDFAIEDCWALRRGGMHEPGAGTTCSHFKTESRGPYACVPMSVRGELSGLLSVCFSEKQGLDDERRAALFAFGNAVALGLSTLQLRETLRERAGNAPRG